MGLKGMSFFGLPMQQADNAPIVWNSFLSVVRPSTIIEIGTAMGGFSALLQMYANTYGMTFVTYDIKDFQMPSVVKINRRLMDIFGNDVIVDVCGLIQNPGVSVVLCDGEAKIKEFNLFAKYLKQGDYILAHDYSESKEYFDNFIGGKVWESFEITDADIEDVCKEQGLERFWQEQFQSIVTVCRRKI